MKQIKKQLLYCQYCISMTNHKGMKCLKCDKEIEEKYIGKEYRYPTKEEYRFNL